MLLHHKNKWKVVIFGAGHVSQELTRLLLLLECEVTVFDHRQEWLNRLPSHAQLVKICTENMSEKVGSLPVDSFIAIMTMGHSTDLPILLSAATQNFPYLGIMGSETKAKVLPSSISSKILSSFASLL